MTKNLKDQKFEQKLQKLVVKASEASKVFSALGEMCPKLSKKSLNILVYDLQFYRVRIETWREKRCKYKIVAKKLSTFF